MISWSVSQSAAWQCPRQWWYSAVAHAKPAQPDAPNRARGRALHAAIERAYRAAVMNPDRPERGFMIQYLDPAIMLLWEIWGHKQRQHEYNTAVAQLTELFLTLPVPAPHAILGIEQRAMLEHTDEYGAYRINCVMDLVLKTGPTSVHIRDWKSNRIDSDIENNVQLAVYDLAARALWPWLTTITVGLYSIAQNREIVTELSKEDRRHGLEALLADASEAYAGLNEARQGVITHAAAFPPVSGDRCASCVFRSYCPKFTGAMLPLRADMIPQSVADERRRLAHRLESVNP